MTKALPNSVRDAAARQAHAPAERGLDWRKRMSDHIAYYRTWNASDLDALVAWVRTIPPLD